MHSHCSLKSQQMYLRNYCKLFPLFKNPPFSSSASSWGSSGTHPLTVTLSLRGECVFLPGQGWCLSSSTLPGLHPQQFPADVFSWPLHTVAPLSSSLLLLLSSGGPWGPSLSYFSLPVNPFWRRVLRLFLSHHCDLVHQAVIWLPFCIL